MPYENNPEARKKYEEDLEGAIRKAFESIGFLYPVSELLKPFSILTEYGTPQQFLKRVENFKLLKKKLDEEGKLLTQAAQRLVPFEIPKEEEEHLLSGKIIRGFAGNNPAYFLRPIFAEDFVNDLEPFIPAILKTLEEDKKSLEKQNWIFSEDSKTFTYQQKKKSRPPLLFTKIIQDLYKFHFESFKKRNGLKALNPKEFRERLSSELNRYFGSELTDPEPRKPIWLAISNLLNPK